MTELHSIIPEPDDQTLTLWKTVQKFIELHKRSIQISLVHSYMTNSCFRGEHRGYVREVLISLSPSPNH